MRPVYSILGPEFKGVSKEIINKLQTLSAKNVFDQISNTGHFELQLENGDTIQLTDKHISFELAKQVHGREVETIDLKNITILIEN